MHTPSKHTTLPLPQSLQSGVPEEVLHRHFDCSSLKLIDRESKATFITEDLWHLKRF